MDNRNYEKIFSFGKIFIPFLIGFFSLFFVLKHNSGIAELSINSFRQLKLWPIFLAFFFIVSRDFAFIARLRVIVGNQISWEKGFYIISIWDFVSCITPSVAGGGVVAIYLLSKEKISIGKSIALILLTAALDNTIFLLISPVGFWTIHGVRFSNFSIFNTNFSFSIKGLFTVSVILVFLYTAFIFISLFISPNFITNIMNKISMNVKFLNRFSKKIIEQSKNIEIASEELKVKSSKFWLIIICYSFIAIISRYAILNSLILSSKCMGVLDNVVVFGNQIILWVLMLLTPTPGSSGVAEIFFSNLYSDLLRDNLILIEILWRFLTYYLHIIVGSLFLIFNKKIKKLLSDYKI